MLIKLIIYLNAAASAIGAVVLMPLQWLPGWLSATLLGLITGVLMLVVFKYTSHQTAIKNTRNHIKANMLALSLFKDNIGVSLRCQTRLLGGALMLMIHSLIPIAVLTLPMLLILGQMSLWYQTRPLLASDEAVVTVQLKSDAAEAVTSVQLTSTDLATVVSGPVRVPSKHMVCWNLVPSQDGVHELRFEANGLTFTKQFSAGAGYQPTSIKRPGHVLADLIIHPAEAPFPPDSLVQSIEVTYPDRDSFTTGTNNWVIYWFLVSMVGALVAKPFLKVNI